MGNAAVVDIEGKFALAQRVICLSPYSDLNSEYLVCVLNSPWFQKQLSEVSSGMTATGVKSARLKLLAIPIPTMHQQSFIAKNIRELHVLCDELEHSLLERNELTKKIAGALAADVVA
jgi:type I restriction enzyme S subunit